MVVDTANESQVAGPKYKQVRTTKPPPASRAMSPQLPFSAYLQDVLPQMLGQWPLPPSKLSTVLKADARCGLQSLISAVEPDGRLHFVQVGRQLRVIKSKMADESGVRNKSQTHCYDVTEDFGARTYALPAGTVTTQLQLSVPPEDVNGCTAAHQASVAEWSAFSPSRGDAEDCVTPAHRLHGVTIGGRANEVLAPVFNRKDHMRDSLQQFLTARGSTEAITPSTFVLSHPAECLAFFAPAQRAKRKEGLWIMKNAVAHFGTDVHPVRDFDTQLVLPYGSCNHSFASLGQVPIVQSAIPPLTLGGRSFDLRAYLLLRLPAPGVPAKAYHLRGSAFLRRCSTPYAPQSEDRLAKICNIHATSQRLFRKASQNKSINMESWDVEKLVGHVLSGQFGATAAGPGFELFRNYPKMAKTLEAKLTLVAGAMVHVFEREHTSGGHIFRTSDTQRAHNWVLTGLDWIIDESSIPWLLEVNLGCLGQCDLGRMCQKRNYTSPRAAAWRLALAMYAEDVHNHTYSDVACDGGWPGQLHAKPLEL